MVCKSAKPVSGTSAIWYTRDIWRNAWKQGVICFMGTSKKGTVCTVVNPSQTFADINLQVTAFLKSEVIYADGGFKPVLKKNVVTLGPEQMAVVAFDEYAHPKYNLGIDSTINIPKSITPVEVNFKETSLNTVSGTFFPVKGKDLRILLQCSM